VISAVTAAAIALPLAAATSPDRTCDAVALRAAAETGVPRDVLRAISLTETGRSRGGTLVTWPWTVNVEGKGHWFETRDEAVDYAERSYALGARSFDIGCFQLNYRWHGAHFATIAEMFDPLANARYAARFLVTLYAESGDWSVAAGTYHSRTEVYAARYRQRFDDHLAAQDGLPPGVPTVEGVERQNLFPLLQAAASAPRALASLVPQIGATTPFLSQSARALR
jgi:hypothetical protein